MRYRALYLTSFAVTVALVAWVWWTLPSGRIPLHFGADGEPDGWGTRHVPMAVLLGTVLGTGGLLGWLASRSETLGWGMVNIPRKDWWSRPENEPLARARVKEDMYLVGSWTLWLLACVTVLVLVEVRRAVETGSAGTSGLLVPLLACVLLAGGVAWRQRWYRRVPDEA